jgi:alkylation response protein AidB-like acyl-CoA dehydrogenase
VRGGRPELKAQVVPGIVAGTTVAAWCIAGPRGGWDGRGVGVDATSAGDTADAGVVLDGVSTPVECGAQADELLVTARTVGGLTQCLVPAAADGVKVEAVDSVDLVRRFATVRFDGVPVPAARIVGEPGGAAAQVERQLHLAIVLQCAEVVGALDRVLDITLEYLGDRSSFGRPLASYQAIKHRIADMKMWIEGCHGVTELAVQAVQDDDPDVVETVSAAASYLGDHAGEILQECTQLHGGIGVTWEHDLHLYLRRITLDRNLFGTPAQHRERIADAIIGKHGELAGA